MEKPAFENFDSFLKSLPVEEQEAIDSGADALALEIEVARMEGKSVKKFGDHLRTLGASLVARLPSGKEIELPIPGVRT